MNNLDGKAMRDHMQFIKTKTIMELTITVLESYYI